MCERHYSQREGSSAGPLPVSASCTGDSGGDFVHGRNGITRKGKGKPVTWCSSRQDNSAQGFREVARSVL